MVVGLAALAGFVFVLGLALKDLSPDVLAALPALSDFIAQLGALGMGLAALSAGDLLGMGVGLALLAGFVYLLGLALGTFSDQALAALPGLAALIGALNDLATSMAALSVGDLITMAVAFALIAGFVWALAAALEYAAGPLASIATILGTVKDMMTAVGSAISGLMGFLGDLGSFASGVFSGIADGVGSVLDALNPFSSLSIPGMGGGGSSALAIASPGAGGDGFGAPTGGAPGFGGGGGGGGGPQSVDQSINLGGVTITINADKLEANASQMLSDQIVQGLRERLGALQSEQGFRTGERPSAA
jgi:hypothetical protein